MTFQAGFLRDDGTVKTVSGPASLRGACLLARELCCKPAFAAQVHRDGDGKMLAQFLTPELDEMIRPSHAWASASVICGEATRPGTR
jgi:hypothetical protein